MTSKPSRKLMRVLDGEAVWPQPIWLMRQAGRYLPEYKETRGHAGGFLQLCYTPEFRRGGHAPAHPPLRVRRLDPVFGHPRGAALRWARTSWFEEGEGPRLDPIATRDDVARLGEAKDPLEHLAPVFETVRPPARRAPRGDDTARLLRRALDAGELHDRRALLARAGAPAARRLSRPGLPDGADREAGRDLGSLPRRPDRRRRGTRCSCSESMGTSLPPGLRRRLLPRPAAVGSWRG